MELEKAPCEARFSATACKRYCIAPAHAGQHKATSPTRKTLCTINR